MSSLGAIFLLVLAAVAVVESVRVVAGRKREQRLSRAMHELRRPLQGLMLIVERGDVDPDTAMACMLRARDALGDLEAIVERIPARHRRREGRLTDVLESSRCQWRPAGVGVDAVTVDGVVPDPDRLGAAIDNLVANALEHGRRPVSLRAGVVGGVAEVEVRDAGAIEPRPRRRDRGRGHGLSIVDEFAARNSGSAGLRMGPPGRGTSAKISIPVVRATTEREAGAG